MSVLVTSVLHKYVTGALIDRNAIKEIIRALWVSLAQGRSDPTRKTRLSYPPLFVVLRLLGPPAPGGMNATQ
jgi:hypothetical protein